MSELHQGTYIVRRLRRLINRHRSSNAHKISLQSQIPTKIDRIPTIQSSRRVIPALQLCACKRSLSDTNALPLTTAYTAHKVAANTGIDRVADAEDGHHDIAHHGVGLRTVYAAGDVPR